ncbi:MAG: DctP family TRAP transporter solute-binding subunit [Firmicutes bacterium]|nr:DctP family TRAP transporter solute-binding subunit [Bacillota bacterium]
MKRLCLALTLVVCVLAMGIAPAMGAPRIIRLNHTLAPDSHYHKGLEKFAELIDQKTNGEVEVQIFHSSQLGSERDAIEGVILGTLEATLVSTAPLANFSKQFLVFDLPFIVKDRATAYKALDGELGAQMAKSLDEKGIKTLAFWENGFRMLTNSRRPIERPEDVAGLKIRLMENPVHMATFKTLGAAPVPMPFGELFTALQQKTVDGQENPLVIIQTSKFYEVQKHLALTGHFYSPAALLIGQKFFDSLTSAQQQAIQEAAFEARDWERQYCQDLEASLVAELKAAGMQVTSPDLDAFEKAVESVYKEFEAEIGADTIRALRGK